MSKCIINTIRKMIVYKYLSNNITFFNNVE